MRSETACDTPIMLRGAAGPMGRSRARVGGARWTSKGLSGAVSQRALGFTVSEPLLPLEGPQGRCRPTGGPGLPGPWCHHPG